MTVSHLPLHIICGACGCKDMLSFEIKENGRCDYNGEEHPAVFIYCKNCSFVTNLEDTITEVREI